jgi:hypothetical protein
MEQAQKGTSIFQILYKSFLIYTKNFVPLTRVMLFPVLGQLLAVLLIFVPNYLYTQKFLPSLSEQSVQQHSLFLIIGVFLIAIPGMWLFIKAFWEYLVAMVSLNTMVKDINDKGFFENFKAHNKAVTERTKDYAILLLILTLISLSFFIFPNFAFFFGSQNVQTILAISVLISAIASIIVSVKLSLAYQIFAFERIAPSEIIKKTWNMTKNNFWRIAFAGIIMGIFTGIVVDVMDFLMRSSKLTNVLAIPIQKYTHLFSTNYLFTKYLEQNSLNIHTFSLAVASWAAKTVINALMLPLGSSVFTLLYFDILERKNADV